MKKSFIFLFAVLGLSIFFYPATEYKLKKTLLIEAGQTYANNIVSLGGEVEIKGLMKESIVMVGGRLKLEGTIRKDLICIASRVEIGKNAAVKGDLIVIGGRLNRAEGSQVGGEIFYFRFDLKKIENTILPMLSDAHTVTFLKTLMLILWFIITLIVFAVIPQKVIRAGEIFGKNVLKIGATGLISMFACLFLLVICVILSFVFIGIPLLLLLIIGYFFMLVFGRTVMFYYLGMKISDTLRIKNITPAFFILVGVIVYAILKFLPILGPIFLVVINILEIGIGVGFLFRKKIAFKT